MPPSSGIRSSNCGETACKAIRRTQEGAAFALFKFQLCGQCPLTMRSILRLSTADHWAYSTGRYDPLVVLNRLSNTSVGDGFPVPAVKGFDLCHRIGEFVDGRLGDGKPVPYDSIN